MYCDYHGGKFIDEYKDYDKAELAAPPLPPEEQFARIVAAFNKLAQTIQNILIPTVENLCANLMPVVKRVTEVVLTYPNKRVVYLALHHGKHRVRKKNLKRITKWIEREGKK